MKRAIFVVLFATAVFAQDKGAVTLRESGVVASGFDCAVQPDAGIGPCIARSSNDAGFEVKAQPFFYNGARSTAVHSAVIQAAKNDNGVGSKGAP
jgi:hypothetical protein